METTEGVGRLYQVLRENRSAVARRHAAITAGAALSAPRGVSHAPGAIAAARSKLHRVAEGARRKGCC